jgi:signal transduction histidine kinase
MRSLYTRILLTSLATLSVSLLAFLIISALVGRAQTTANFKAFGRLELELAVIAYHADGPGGLARYTKRLDGLFRSTHYVVDRSGTDLVSGENRSYMIPRTSNRQALLAAATQVRHYLLGTELISANYSDDGNYCIIAVSRPWNNTGAQLPYYVFVLIIISVLYSFVAVRIVSSLRAISRAAERFGQGELDARVEPATRRDEIGDLARTFNSMADHIRMLVSSQRRLLQDVSHELRSPLARLAFAAELARAAPDRDAAIDQIKKQLNCLTDLVAGLLQLTRAEGEPAAATSDQVVLDAVVQEVVATCALQAEERRCQLIVRGSASQVCRGDRILVTRAVDNVLRNAIQHSLPDGLVEIVITDETGWVFVAIRDYGCGVPEPMLSRIFEPFFRVDDSRQHSTGGVGLGLAIVQRIVEVHHGVVRAENMSPGLKITIGFSASSTVAHQSAFWPRSAA